MMPDIRFLLKVSRPRFWIYIFGPYLVGLAAGVAGKIELLNWRFAVFAVYFLLPANLLVYGVNDIFDYETDKLNPKKAGYEALVTPDRRPVLFQAILWLNLPFYLFGVFQYLAAANLILVPFVLLSVFYSAPPIRAKTKPLLDSAFNILYIMPGVFAYSLASGGVPPVTLIVAGGLWTAAMHAFSAIPDIDADREAGLTTIATAFGSIRTHLFCLAAYIGAATLAYPYLSLMGIALGIVYSIAMIVSIMSGGREGVFRVYRFFPLLNAACGFAIFWYIAWPKFF